MSQLQRINLHVGAHKTASTHLQRRLAAERKALLAYGVAFDGPAQWRQATPGNALFKPRTPLQTILQEKRGLRRFAPKAPVWLVSEENIAGLPRDLLKPGPLYARLPGRVRHFDRLFRSASVRLFLAVRSYDDYFRSMYCELLRKFPLPPFRSFYDETEFARRSWFDVVERLASVLPEDAITLWRYEDFGSLEERIVDALTGGRLPDDFRLPVLAGRTRPSLSARAVSALHSAPAASRDKHRQRVGALMRRHPVSASQDTFSPWHAEERQALRDRYADDLERIRNRFPGIDFLAPP